MWTLDEILLAVTLSGRFLAIGLLLAVVVLAVARSRRSTRQEAFKTAGARGGPGLHAFSGGPGGSGQRPAAPAPRREDEGRRKRRAAAYRRGILTFVGLAVLTAIEFVISLDVGSLVLLFLTGLLKAAIIINYFMNVSRLWTAEGEEHA